VKSYAWISAPDGIEPDQGIPVAVEKGFGYSSNMPLDPNHYEEEKGDPGEKEGRRRSFQDFDCPTCNANNPYDDGYQTKCFHVDTPGEFVVTAHRP